MSKETFGRLLRAARQRSVLTMEGLSEASGVSVRAISDMERGRSLPRRATLGELMDVLGLDDAERARMLQASSPNTDRVPRQLPPGPAQFRGHESALRAVLSSVDQDTGQDRHVVITAVSGMAGVGKTTLAVHCAHQVAERFPGGQLYVDLRGFEESKRPLEPVYVLGDFLRALGVPGGNIPADAQDQGALFRERTAARRLIVVLDNARDTEQVTPLLPAVGSLALITSRNQLFGLAAIEGASLIGLDAWTRDEALAALADHVGDDRCRAEPEAAAELVDLCGRLPLAIAELGSQLAAQPGTLLHPHVQQLRAARLDTLSSDAGRRDVRTAISSSYRTLEPETARFFQHLAICPEPSVSAETAAALCGVDTPTARRRLRELAAASLLARDTDGRYVMHTLLKDYGAELTRPEPTTPHPEPAPPL